MALTVDSMVPSSYLRDALAAGQGRSAWKFVVIETAEGFHIVCGPIDEYRYHANLVASFCNRKEIGAMWEHKPDLVEILDSAVKIHGGGHIQFDLTAGSARVYGRSTAYGAYRPAHLVELDNASPIFRDFIVKVDGL